MARKMPKIAQPPIDPATRPSEHHLPLWGLLIAILAGGSILYGSWMSYNVDGEPNSELQMVHRARTGHMPGPEQQAPAVAPGHGEESKTGTTTAPDSNQGDGGTTTAPDSNGGEEKKKPDEKKQGDDFCPT